MKIGVPFLVLTFAVASPLFGAENPTMTLDAAAQSRLGVVTAPLTAARHSGTVEGYARVLDLVPLATLDADLVSAVALAEASQAEANRTRTLAAADATVSLKVAQAAAAQARGDAAKVALLRRRLSLEWGPALAGDATRSAILADAVAGRAALVRIDPPPGTAQFNSAVIDLGPNGRVSVRILGPTRVGDARLQSAGFIGLASGPQAIRLASGMAAPAALSLGGVADGVVVPRSALIRVAGQTFAYVRRDATHFERRVANGGVPTPAGIFLSGGFRPGEAVVVAGGAALLAAASASPKSEP